MKQALWNCTVTEAPRKFLGKVGRHKWTTCLPTRLGSPEKQWCDCQLVILFSYSERNKNYSYLVCTCITVLLSSWGNRICSSHRTFVICVWFSSKANLINVSSVNVMCMFWMGSSHDTIDKATPVQKSWGTGSDIFNISMG